VLHAGATGCTAGLLVHALRARKAGSGDQRQRGDRNHETIGHTILLLSMFALPTADNETKHRRFLVKTGSTAFVC
jgi:hypothetical protein